MFDEFTSGAAGDLKMATQNAHRMVCEWGMSELGPICFGTNSEVFLGRDFMREREYSEETASAVDSTIHKLLEDAYADAKDIMIKHRKILEAIADELVERETISGNEVDDIIRKNGGKDLIPPPPPPSAKPQEVEDKLPGIPDPEPSKKKERHEELPPGDIVPGTA
jgi:cell division protease FtsH